MSSNNDETVDPRAATDFQLSQKLDLSKDAMLKKMHERRGSSSTSSSEEEVEADKGFTQGSMCVKWSSQASPQASKTTPNADLKAARAPSLAASEEDIGSPLEINCDDEKENDEPVLMPPTQPPVAGQNWPLMGKLMTLPTLVKLLQAVNLFGCAPELSANDSDNPKGNKWSRLCDHCCGGVIDVDVEETLRGLLGGHLAVLPVVSKLKSKAVSIWTHVNKEVKKPRNTVPDKVRIVCQRQNNEMEESKKVDKEATQNQKDRDAILQAQVKKFQRDIGAIPPSAKGKEGMGRREHSTNLIVEEPATFSFSDVNAMPTAATPSSHTNRRSSKSPVDSSLTKSSGAGTVHTEAMGELSGFTRRFNAVCNEHFGTEEETSAGDNKETAKRRRLLEAKKNHMETIPFLRPLKDECQESETAHNQAILDLVNVDKHIKQSDMKATGVKEETDNNNN